MPTRCLKCKGKKLALQTKFCLTCLFERTGTKDELELLTQKFTGKPQVETSYDGVVMVKIV